MHSKATPSGSPVSGPTSTQILMREGGFQHFAII